MNFKDEHALHLKTIVEHRELSEAIEAMCAAECVLLAEKLRQHVRSENLSEALKVESQMASLEGFTRLLAQYASRYRVAIAG